MNASSPSSATPSYSGLPTAGERTGRASNILAVIDSSEVDLAFVCVHRIGNKLRQEGVLTSDSPLQLTKQVSRTLLNYFFNHFRRSTSVYKLTHPAGKGQNAIYAISSRIFRGEPALAESQKAAAHLYDVSDHPRINQGELYVVHFRNIRFEGKLTDAVGYFKADHSDEFIKVDFQRKAPLLVLSDGTRVKSFDKGALVINQKSSDGFRVLQAVSQSEEASYWKDQFLKSTLVSTDAEHTSDILRICNKYSQSLEDEHGPAQKARFLDASYAYFAENEDYSSEIFTKHLPPEIADSFQKFKEDYETANEVSLPGRFAVVPNVLKKHKKFFSAIIRLDDCIEIKVTPTDGRFDITRVEKGFDRKKGLNFYKFYFTEEN